MPRQPRLDAPGALHHVMGRGIERTKVFPEDADREDFVTRLAALCRDRHLAVYAWVLMPTHFHLLVRTGDAPLAQNMRKLLTGYVVNFNRRHKRGGHLFQNRYKSIICEEEPYLLVLTRYIHLNPVRGGILARLSDLRRYLWAGHSAILGVVERDWQDTTTILSSFGRSRRQARERYEEFVREGFAQGKRPELVGGGLVRSLGGWAQVLSLRRKGGRAAADDRILGSGEFVEQLLAEAGIHEKETLRLSQKRMALGPLAEQLGGQEIKTADLQAGGRQRAVVRARRLFCQVAVKHMGYSGAEVARFLGLTTSSVNRLAASEELLEATRYRNVL